MRCRPIIALTALAAIAAPATAHPDADIAIAARMHLVAASFEWAQLFCGSILVACAGKPILQRSYGLADAGRKTPNTINTKYRMGLITKQLTAAAIPILHEQGRLSLDDPLPRI